MMDKLFETDSDVLRPYKYCGALLFAAEVLPVLSVLVFAACGMQADTPVESVAAMISSYAGLFGIMLLGMRRAGVRAGFGLRAADIPAGVAAAAAFYPSAVIVGSAASVLFGAGTGSTSEIALFVSGTGTYLAMLALAVVPAVVEELMVRGFLYGTIRSRRGAMPAIAVTALCFGMLHQGPAQAVYAAYCGIYLGMLRERTGRVWAGVAAHCALNLTAIFFSTPASDAAMAVLDSIPVPAYAGAAVLLAGICTAALCRGVCWKDGRQGLFPVAISIPGLLFLAGAICIRVILS